MVRKPVVVQTYVRIRQTKDADFIKQFATLDEDAKETRDQYLDLLEDHLHDVHAHVRSSVLQSWCKLCLAKAIPLARIRQLLKLVVGRIRDR